MAHSTRNGVSPDVWTVWSTFGHPTSIIPVVGKGVGEVSSVEVADADVAEEVVLEEEPVDVAAAAELETLLELSQCK